MLHKTILILFATFVISTTSNAHHYPSHRNIRPTETASKPESPREIKALPMREQPSISTGVLGTLAGFVNISLRTAPEGLCLELFKANNVEDEDSWGHYDTLGISVSGVSRINSTESGYFKYGLSLQREDRNRGDEQIIMPILVLGTRYGQGKGLFINPEIGIGTSGGSGIIDINLGYQF